MAKGHKKPGKPEQSGQPMTTVPVEYEFEKIEPAVKDTDNDIPAFKVYTEQYAAFQEFAITQPFQPSPFWTQKIGGRGLEQSFNGYRF